MPHLERAEQLDPTNPQAHDNLGVALLVLGHPDQAAEHFRTALRLKPDFTGAAEHLQQVQRALH